MGVGWNNPYMGYHQGWQHGYWNGNFGGGWGWRPYGYGYGLGGMAWGLWPRRVRLRARLGPGHGLWAGGFRRGCSGRCSITGATPITTTPITAAAMATAATRSSLQQPVVYDYSQPIDPQSPPPDETVVNQATTVFDSAREAFKNGDYAKALELVDQALKTTPNDAALHEFRALVPLRPQPLR